MRTPQPTQSPITQRELTEQLADGLAALLVAEFRARHPEYFQQDRVPTVVSPSGLNHTGDEPATEVTSDERARGRLADHAAVAARSIDHAGLGPIGRRLSRGKGPTRSPESPAG